MTYWYVLAAMALRLLPHPWNMTPMGAIFLFSGATLKHKGVSLLFPLSAVALSTVAVMALLYSHCSLPGDSPFTWLGFAAMGMAGWSLRREFSWPRMFGASLAGSLLFFLISNFGAWATGTLYPHHWGGLMECYLAGIPFFSNTLLGDLLYSVILFGVYQALHTRLTCLEGASR